MYAIHVGGMGLCGDLMGSFYSGHSGIPVVLVVVRCCPLPVHWP